MVIGWQKWWARLLLIIPRNHVFLPYCPAQKILTPRFVGPRFESEDYTNLGIVTGSDFFLLLLLQQTLRKNYCNSFNA